MNQRKFKMPRKKTQKKDETTELNLTTETPTEPEEAPEVIDDTPKPVTAYWKPSDWNYVRSHARERGLKIWSLLSEMTELYRAEEEELRK